MDGRARSKVEGGIELSFSGFDASLMLSTRWRFRGRGLWSVIVERVRDVTKRVRVTAASRSSNCYLSDMPQ